MKWKISANDPVETFLLKNGLDTDEKREDFFGFKPENFRSKYKDLTKVVNKIAKAVKDKKVITIYGDYDCDGINATVILLRSLKQLGIKANYFINNRFTEGYGLNVLGMERLLSLYPETQFIITCDNGIAAQDGIRYALNRGIDVVCTDHHRQNGEIIVPTVDEWRDDESVTDREESCGAEIARRVMMAVFKKLEVEDKEFFDKLITFSGIATVADVVKFTASNHYLVKRGLELLNNPVYPVINLMIQALNIIEVDEESIGFQVAPLFNALSRVEGDPSPMVELLIRDKADIETYEMILRLIEVNQRRKDMTTENLSRAMESSDLNASCVVAAGQYDLGIAGLVCSSIVEEFNKPCICLNFDGENYKGSARSYGDFDLKSALDECADMLLGYGGHAGAAGLTVKGSKLEDFKKKISSLVDKSGVLNKEPEVIIDYEADVDDLYDSTVETLMSFGPFGEGFEKPKIAYKGIIKKATLLPKKEVEKKHVSFKLCGDNAEINVLWWNSINRWKSFLEDASSNEVEILGSPKFDLYNGLESFKIIMNDIRAN